MLIYKCTPAVLRHFYNLLGNCVSIFMTKCFTFYFSKFLYYNDTVVVIKLITLITVRIKSTVIIVINLIMD